MSWIHLLLLCLLALPLVEGLSVAPARYDLGNVMPGERYPLRFSMHNPEGASVTIGGNCSIPHGIPLGNRTWLTIPEYVSGREHCVMEFTSAGSIGIRLGIPVTYNVTQDAERSVVLRLRQAAYEQFMPTEMLVDIYNAGNVLEEGELCVIAAGSTTCHTVSAYPHQEAVEAFELPAFNITGKHNISAVLNGFSIEQEIKVLPIGSISVNGTLDVSRTCQDSLILETTFTNTGSLPGVLTIQIPGETQKRYVGAGQTGSFVFRTDLPCSASVLVTATLHSRRFTHLSTIDSPLTGMMTRENIQRSGLGLLAIALVLGIMFVIKKFIYKSVN